MFKKPVQRGRDERRAEEVHTKLHLNRSLRFICERIVILPPVDLDRYVEGLSKVRTTPGARRVSATGLGG